MCLVSVLCFSASFGEASSAYGQKFAYGQQFVGGFSNPFVTQFNDFSSSSWDTPQIDTFSSQSNDFSFSSWDTPQIDTFSPQFAQFDSSPSPQYIDTFSSFGTNSFVDFPSYTPQFDSYTPQFDNSWSSYDSFGGSFDSFGDFDSSYDSWDSSWDSYNAWDDIDIPTSSFDNAFSTWGDSGSSNSFAKPTKSYSHGPKTEGGTIEQFCDQSRVRTFNIIISDENIAILNGDISAEEYVPCGLVTDFQTPYARTYEGAGCKYKGAVGSLLNCLDPYTGRPNGGCRKLSLKVDANRFREDSQKIDGMKRINFHGMAVDKALVSERLSYNLLREAGIAAPCAVHGEIFVNGQFDSVYSLVQDMESGVTENFFANDYNQGKGALYKDFWFRPEQSTNKWLEEQGEQKDEHAFMMEVSTAIQNAPESQCSVMEQYFDLDVFAKITAMNDLLGQTDDWRQRHNFFWYVREDWQGKKLVMLPWDYDRLDDQGGGLAFRRRKIEQWWNGNFNPNKRECVTPPIDPATAGMEMASDMQRLIMERTASASPPLASTNIACDKITRMFANCAVNKVKSYFTQYRMQFPITTMENKINTYVNQISPTVIKDTSINQNTWRQDVRSLIDFLTTAPGYAPGAGSSLGAFGKSDAAAAAGTGSRLGFTFFGR